MRTLKERNLMAEIFLKKVANLDEDSVKLCFNGDTIAIAKAQKIYCDIPIAKEIGGFWSELKEKIPDIEISESHKNGGMWSAVNLMWQVERANDKESFLTNILCFRRT